MAKIKDKKDRKGGKDIKVAEVITAAPERITADSPADADTISKKEKKKRKRDDEPDSDRSKKSRKRKESGSAISEQLAESGETAIATEKKAKRSKSKADGVDKVTEEPTTEAGEKDVKKKTKKSKKAKAGTELRAEAPEEAEAPSPVPAHAADDYIPLNLEPTHMNGAQPTDPTSSADKPSKLKKEKKKKSKATKEERGILDTADAEGGARAEEIENFEDPSAEKNSRFVVFVGNLPFSATKEQIQEHFISLKPSSVRIMTDRNTKKPKGFAFVEFGKFDRMQTCLKKFNHSVFPDGKNGRKINIELTAGGGGNNASRRDKIQYKNERLNNQRENDRLKRDEIKSKQSDRQEKKEARQKKDVKNEADSSPSSAPQEQDNHGGMHPARLAQLNGNGPRRAAVRF